MDDLLIKTLELCRDPMLILREGKLCCLNLAARSLFGTDPPGVCPPELEASGILSVPAERFLSTVSIRGRGYAVSALRDGSDLLLSLSPESPPQEVLGCLSDGLLTEMRSELCNLGLAMERLRSVSERGGDPSKYLAVLNHNYHLLNHRLSNLTFCCAAAEKRLMVVLRSVDLAALCRGIADTIHAAAPDCAGIEFSSTEDPFIVCVDTAKVERLILNLLSNSLRHSPADRPVRLRLSRSGSNVVLCVDDSGCGIPPEKLRNVFCSYRNRMDDRNPSLSGAGLGLGICQRIAELHGGALILESRPGEGTSVRVLLPLDPPGANQFRAGDPSTDAGGMSVLLTELSDVLPLSAYGPRFSD